MKKALERINARYWYYDSQGVRHNNESPSGISGNLSGISGDLSRVRGNLSRVSGDLSEVSGNLSGIRGNLSGISGDLSGVRGDLSKCDITNEDREKGINIEDLIQT